MRISPTYLSLLCIYLRVLINTGNSSELTESSQLKSMMVKLMSDVAVINKNVEDLYSANLRMSKEIVQDIRQSCNGIQNSNSFSNSPALTKLADIESLVPNQSANVSQPAHAIRCSSYRALNEFIPVKDVTSNDLLLEAGWDATHGPMYFCHALVNINGIECRLYGKGNRRTCWVSLPGGRVHWVTDKFHLLRKPLGVNVEWRSGWPTDAGKSPVAELKTAGGVVYESAVWDIYTCGLIPRFYFGRCDRNGVKVPGMIHAGESLLKYTFGGSEQTCKEYEVLVCINK